MVLLSAIQRSKAGGNSAGLSSFIFGEPGNMLDSDLTLLAIVAELEQKEPPLPAGELGEGRAFLRWLADNHFTFLGYRRHDLVDPQSQRGES